MSIQVYWMIMMTMMATHTSAQLGPNGYNIDGEPSIRIVTGSLKYSFDTTRVILKWNYTAEAGEATNLELVYRNQSAAKVNGPWKILLPKLDPKAEGFNDLSHVQLKWQPYEMKLLAYYGDTQLSKDIPSAILFPQGDPPELEISGIDLAVIIPINVALLLLVLGFIAFLVTRRGKPKVLKKQRAPGEEGEDSDEAPVVATAADVLGSESRGSVTSTVSAFANSFLTMAPPNRIKLLEQLEAVGLR